MKKCCVLFLAVLFSAIHVSAQKIEQIHAASVYHFSKLITWEGDDSETFNICVYGSTEFYREIQTIAANRTVNGKPISVQEAGSIEGIQACHILYVKESETDQLNKIWEKISPYQTTLITDNAPEDFENINLNFIIKDKRPAFEIYPPNFTNRKLKVDKTLLQKAIIRSFD